MGQGQTIRIRVFEGVGLCQRRGEPIQVIKPGDRVFFEPGEEHWHGAAPDRFMAHLALQQVDDEGSRGLGDPPDSRVRLRAQVLRFWTVFLGVSECLDRESPLRLLGRTAR